MTLRFPDLDALHWAITGGVLAADVMMSRARFARDDGGIFVTPSRPIPPAAVELLQQFGVTIDADEPADARPADHWLQIAPAVRGAAWPEVGPQTAVIFELDDAGRLAALVHEMLRLGCDRQWLAAVGPSRFFLRAAGPPYYSLLRAAERNGDSGPRAYLEHGPRLWVEIGSAHPFERSAAVPDGRMVLVRPPHDWETLPEPAWRDVYDALRLEPPTNRAVVAEALTPLDVPLTLTAGGTAEPPALWVVRHNAVDQLDTFVQSADARLLERLAFAAGKRNGQTIVAVRLRPSKLPPPEVTLDALACRPHLRLPNLFVPVGCRIDPPLRRETVRKLLAPDPAIITWLTPAADGSPVAESLPDEAFRPLSAWVDHVLDRDRAALSEWVRAADFLFGRTPAREEPTIERPAAPLKPAKAEPPVAKPAAPKPERMKKPPAPAKPSAVPAAAGPAPRVSVLRQQLSALEERFLAVDGPLDHPDRQALWPPLAQLNTELRQSAESALAWTHALWETAPTNDALWGWVHAERALPQPELTAADLDRLLNAPVSAAAARAVAAMMVWSAYQAPTPAALRPRLADVQAYLRANEELLPARAAWLAWVGWSRLAGGDALRLARARDRALERLLERGLSAETDLPAFLRFAGRQDADRLREVRGWVEEIRGRLRDWYQSQTGVNLAADPTAAYIDLMFAFAFARLGEATAARGLVRQADTILSETGDDTHEAHAFLDQAFHWRIEDVLAGRPHAGPLPQDLLDYLANMRAEEATLPNSAGYTTRRLCSYAVDRMREQSRILEPQERFDPYRGYTARHEGNELIREAARWPDVRNTGQLPNRINELLRKAANKPDLRVRLLAEAVALAGRLGAEPAALLLDRVVPALDAAPPTADAPSLETRLRLIERSLFFAAHYDRGTLVSGLVERLVRLVEADSSAAVLDSAGPAVGQTLRGLRKLGLRDETLRIIDRVAGVVLRGQTVDQLVSRRARHWHEKLLTLLHLAAGWRFFDQAEKAEPVLAAGRALLFKEARTPEERVPPIVYKKLLCAQITAIGAGPPAEARARLVELFASDRLEKLARTMTTTAFYSWFHLNAVEAVALTLASDDFALGPVTRRWLDEDEYLVRRRIHRDVREALEPGS